jgi:hypothetical protein
VYQIQAAQRCSTVACSMHILVVYVNHDNVFASSPEGVHSRGVSREEDEGCYEIYCRRTVLYFSAVRGYAMYYCITSCMYVCMHYMPR